MLFPGDSSPTVKKQNEEWFLIGLIIRSGEFGLYSHEVGWPCSRWLPAATDHDPVLAKAKVTSSSFPSRCELD